MAGATLFVLAGLYALEARGYVVGFVTDPLGPRAFPYLAAALLAVGGVWLVVRPGARVDWPARATLAPLAAAAASLIVYASLLAPLGFLVTTTLIVTLLSVLFGGRVRHALPAAIALALTLYAVFVYGLGLPLPPGALFRGS